MFSYYVCSSSDDGGGDGGADFGGCGAYSVTRPISPDSGTSGTNPLSVHCDNNVKCPYIAEELRRKGSRNFMHTQ
uniref:Uncharacterized protein n=1 Tax=Glossina morsitans morsitans TaxID=37546 RepID=A0A1B0GAI7_GLOMM